MNFDYISSISEKSGPESLEEFTARYYKLIIENRKLDDIRDNWRKHMQRYNPHDPVLKMFEAPKIDLQYLPKYSFFIQFRFTLEKPYISKDEREFYIIDNPIRKDKVFSCPYVAPSSWKGSLRAALWKLGHKEEANQIKRIFGNKRAEQDQKKVRRGRLHLFPTFFTKIDFEVINPHDRDRKVGTNPILFEVVPVGASGQFTLLYVPFDLVGTNENIVKLQFTKDLDLLIDGLNSMFRSYGFGAKTSSGYGIAKPELSDGKMTLRVKANQKEATKPEPPEESFEKYLNKGCDVKEMFKGSGEAGLMSNSEYGKKEEQTSGETRAEFKRFRKWYAAHGEDWHKYILSKDKKEKMWLTQPFESFDELRKLKGSLNQVGDQ